MRTLALAAAILVMAMSSGATAQFQRRGGRNGFGPSPGVNPKYDGAFTFCRIMVRNAPDGDGAGWFVDWPRADINLSFRLSELTTTLVSKDTVGDFNHVVIRLTDPEL